MPGNSPADRGLVERIARAIAKAEGFFATDPLGGVVGATRPQRNNNPGDLTVDLTGKRIGWDGPFVRYASEADGWEALYAQVEKMLDGTSKVYKPGDTIDEVARKYTTTGQESWASIVANDLGATVDTPLNELA